MADASQSERLLIKLCERGDIRGFDKALRDQRLNVNERDDDGDTALIKACFYGHTQCVERLLKVEGVKVDARNSDDKRPLAIACMNGHVECVDLLLAEGVDVNTRFNWKFVAVGARLRAIAERLDRDLNRPRWLPLTRYHEKSYDSNVPFDDKYYESKFGQTALMMALAEGQMDCVNRLLQVESLEADEISKVVDYLLYQDNENNTNVATRIHLANSALLLSSQKGLQDLVVRLIGLELININATDKDKSTAIMLASRNGHDECLYHLLKVDHININVKDKHEMTALMIACHSGHMTCVDLLLKMPCIDVNLKGETGETALTLASYKGCALCVTRLLKVKNINIEDLYEAVKKDIDKGQDGDDIWIEWFVRNKDINVDVRRKLGNVALIRGSQKGHTFLVDCLLKADTLDVNAADEMSMMTALMFACENGHERCVSRLCQVENVEVNIKNKNDMSSLMIACHRGNKACVDHLLKTANIDINAITNENETALMIAASQGHADCVNLLLEKPRVDVNASNNKGRTAFMMACKNGAFEIVNRLLQRVDINFCFKNSKGETALMLASYEGHADCLNQLFKIENINMEDLYEAVKKEMDKKENRDFNWIDRFLGNDCIDSSARDQLCYVALMMASKEEQAVLVEFLLNVNIRSSMYCAEYIIQLRGLEFESMFNVVRKEINRKGDIGIDCIDRLLKNVNIDENVRRQLGESVLILSSRKRLSELVGNFAEMNLIDINAKDIKHSTALMIACYRDSIACVEHLLKNPNIDVNAHNLDGFTALTMASFKGNLDCMSRLLRTESVDINAVDKRQWTALMWACNEGKTDCVRCLLETMDIDVNARDKEHMTSLIIACLHGHYEIVDHLLRSESIDTNVKCNSGHTALMLASYGGHFKCVDRLLQVEAIDVNATDDSGSNALSLALENNMFKCVKRLVPIILERSEKKGQEEILVAENEQ